MTDADCSIRQTIAWLRYCRAVIRGTTALWPFWWPVLHACEAEATRLERTLAHHSEAPAETIGAEVIDFSEWRRRRAAALVWQHQQPTGGVA